MRGDFEVCDIDGSPAAHAACAALQHRVMRGAAGAFAGSLSTRA
jgi:hypothetical protein